MWDALNKEPRRFLPVRQDNTGIEEPKVWLIIMMLPPYARYIFNIFFAVHNHSSLLQYKKALILYPSGKSCIRYEFTCISTFCLTQPWEPESHVPKPQHRPQPWCQLSPAHTCALQAAGWVQTSPTAQKVIFPGDQSKIPFHLPGNWWWDQFHSLYKPPWRMWPWPLHCPHIGPEWDSRSVYGLSSDSLWMLKTHRR